MAQAGATGHTQRNEHVLPGQVTQLFRDPGAAEGGGYVLAVAGVLVALGLLFHPLPSGGFAEKASVLSHTPLWARFTWPWRLASCCVRSAGSSSLSPVPRAY